MNFSSTATLHARSRLQQRAIPLLVIHLLDQCGSVVRCSGADRLIFDKAAKKRLVRYLGGSRSIRLVERWLNVYAVLTDDTGEIITVARRTRRILRD